LAQVGIVPSLDLVLWFELGAGLRFPPHLLFDLLNLYRTSRTLKLCLTAQ
jgi:hypothetical protein